MAPSTFTTSTPREMRFRLTRPSPPRRKPLLDRTKRRRSNRFQTTGRIARPCTFPLSSTTSSGNLQGRLSLAEGQSVAFRLLVPCAKELLPLSQHCARQRGSHAHAPR